MPRLTSEEAKQFDRFARETLGIPSIILMENAGRGAAETAKEMLEKISGKSVLVVCGKGNNGGDGLAAARHLINFGYPIKIYIIGNPQDLKGDPKINYEILKNMKAAFENDLSSIENTDLIIDAIFGIGLSSGVKEPYREIIEKINSSLKPVLSLDVPSGLDSTTGKIMGIAVKAAKTVTFVAPKTGFCQNDGPKVCGEIIVKDIGITPS